MLIELLRGRGVQLVAQSELISPVEVVEKLTDRNLDWHLNHYDDPDPIMNNAPFYENTPFISVTAGAVEREAFFRRNIVFDPFVTALRFATRDFTIPGHVFYAYVFTLGRQSIDLREFAEEVRELNIYKNFLPFHPEGEITAKIEIAVPQIEKWEEYDGPAALGHCKVPTCPSQRSCRSTRSTRRRRGTAISAAW